MTQIDPFLLRYTRHSQCSQQSQRNSNLVSILCRPPPCCCLRTSCMALHSAVGANTSITYTYICCMVLSAGRNAAYVSRTRNHFQTNTRLSTRKSHNPGWTNSAQKTCARVYWYMSMVMCKTPTHTWYIHTWNKTPYTYTHTQRTREIIALKLCKFHETEIGFEYTSMLRIKWSIILIQ